MRVRDDEYLAQLGCLNSGALVAEADFDELRIWDRPRYDGDFVPEKGVAKSSEGLLYFGFEGSLEGSYLRGGKTGAIRARPGAQPR